MENPRKSHEPKPAAGPLDVLARLEQRFGCLWGSNSYLTPGKTQGFAPHYDDVEVPPARRKKHVRELLWRHNSISALAQTLPEAGSL